MNDVSFLFLFFLGAMTVTRELYPMGFYVVMIAKTNDYKCQTQMKINGLRDAFPVIFNRIKEVELTIVREITQEEYAMAVLGALGMFCGFYLTVFLISCVLCLKDYGEGSVDEDRRPIISSIEMPDSSKNFFYF